ncbi:MAG: hypothetical protein U1C57_00190 [Candidatus Doudnabacteria bacterium]|nr:hypothetical protein [bacterium]MDZ4243509.1 hypothetical protein [Candidatus Doudnabacteria bacterium]
MTGQTYDLKKEISGAAPRPGFELTEAQMERLRRVGEVALGVSVIAGTAAVSVVAPNIFSALDKIFGKKQYGTRRNTLARREEQVIKSFYYMRRQGYIKIKKRGDLLIVHPMELGQRRLVKLKFENLSVRRPRSWQGLWWLVLADIPSKQFRAAADMFQKKLKQMDFYPLQRTAWVYPFDPRTEVEAVAAHYRISPFVTTMEVKRLDKSDEEVLRDFFREKGLI